MRKAFLQRAGEDLDNDAGCGYVIDDAGGRRICGVPRGRSSSYCPYHHSLCYIVTGTKAETKRLREMEALASAVGGRRAQQAPGPSRRFLERLEHALRELQ
jgi:hypothetical protein